MLQARNPWEMDDAEIAAAIGGAQPASIRIREAPQPTPIERRREERADAAERRAEARERRELERAQREARMGYRNTRQLPETSRRTLDEGVTRTMSLDRAFNGFDDDFGGNLLGGLENWLQSYNSGLGTPGQNQFWADVYATDNVERHTLFGASLTEGERAAWERTTVNPRMDPREIRARLDRRREIARDVTRRLARTYRANGYIEDAIRETLGELSPLLDEPSAPARPNNWIEGAAGRAASQDRDAPPAASDDAAASGSLAPPEDGGSRRAPPGTELRFNDEPAPPQPTDPWTPEQERLYDAWMRANPRATAAELQAFARGNGLGDIANAEQIIRARDAGGGVVTGRRASTPRERVPRQRQNDYRISVTPFPGGPALSVGTRDIDATVRGAADVLSLGLGDEIAAAGDTIFNGGTYQENLYNQRGIDAYDSENLPAFRLSGQVGAGFALPTFGARGAIPLARVGAGYGGAYGFGSGDGGIGDRILNAGEGAAVGAAIPAAFSGGANLIARLSRRGGGGPSPAFQLAEAADELGIDVLPADVGGSVTRRATGALAQTLGGASPIISAARRSAEQGGAARARIAAGVGQAELPEMAGQAAIRGGRSFEARTGARGTQLYDDAFEAAGVDRVPVPQARAVLEQNIAELGETIGGMPPEAAPLQQMLDDIAARGEFTIRGIRASRTALRDRFPLGSNANRIARQVVDAAADDIAAHLDGIGRTEAAAAFRTADRYWRQRLTTIDETIEPFLGRDGRNRLGGRSGETVVRNLQTAARGDIARLQRFVQSLPADEASVVRASLISEMGVPAVGQADDAVNFSFGTFLSNWNALTQNGRDVGRARRVFGADAADALNRLATVSRGSRQTQRFQNFSNTGGVVGNLATGATLAVDWLAPLGALAAQNALGRLLASPRFARWLARPPRDRAIAMRRLGDIAAREPALAPDINLIEGLLEGGARSAAAEDTGDPR